MAVWTAASASGSSPHVRGALVYAWRGRDGEGIIPACAGSTQHHWFGRGERRDHPRMCGEHAVMDMSDSTDKGSSPHVRGAPEHGKLAVHVAGIIPACAGSTSCFIPPVFRVGDHPRMCGEHVTIPEDALLTAGSSPHVRGARGERIRQSHGLGIIPACAGSTTGRAYKTTRRRDHPRMCGEHFSVVELSMPR